MELCESDHNGSDCIYVPQRRPRYDLAESIVSYFDLLPDELVMAVLKWAPDGATVDAWSLTSRRHYMLGADLALWRHLCETHFGPLLHQHFQRWGKDWRWIYCARSCDGRTGRVRVGEVDVLLNGKRGTYWGDLVDGKPHGYGVMLIPPLREPGDGGDDQQQQHGQSVQPPALAKLDCYEGEWNNGIISGYGICRWACGMRYKGEYRDNDRHGCGVQTWPNGARYEGGRKNGQRHGYGVHTWASNNQYLGEWVDDRMHGHGIYRWADGMHCEGRYDNNRLTGRGIMTYLDGSTYDGEWFDDRKHGEGAHTYSDGSITWERWSHGTRDFITVLTHRTQDPPCSGDSHPTLLCKACAAVQSRP
ncbi:Morn repeat domain containing protein [Pandoravirus quercus]|uniref:Morn repeat domain containing protein n=2 Tax=Pandoravirus TaxID=2060084 RepID=A0A2U7U977_9VIRU|nr:Morn repeat domain containing protein [Pandoravirus quercus]AVK74930.1 Morn repeat domain containing protein [Pandoravirus quercus]QBZ81117.1 morn repeat incomplete domain containing protein [Pandoravirus celtis]